MIFLKYQKGDLFQDLEDKKEIILLHSCNAKNVWGSGIAKIFYTKFPQAYFQYSSRKNSVGDGYVVEDGEYKIGCLITSENYGKLVDPPMKIADSTYRAIKNLLESTKEDHLEIHSPKINFGLFRTPWKLTEEAIKTAGKESTKEIHWTVFEL